MEHVVQRTVAEFVTVGTIRFLAIEVAMKCVSRKNPGGLAGIELST